MNTEKKANKFLIAGGFIFIIAAVVFVLGAWGVASAQPTVEEAGVSDYVYPKTETGTYEFPTFTWQTEGYEDLATWWDDLKAKRAEYAGKAEEAISAYGSYLSEEQQNKLRDLENELVSATSFAEIDELDAQFNEVVSAGETAKADAEALAAQQSATVSTSSGGSYSSGGSGNYSGSYYDFLTAGIVYHNGNKFSYYSQSVLPGGGLNIPGRHTDGGFVRDGDGYICVANDGPLGSVISTPWGEAKIYDRGTSGNHYDVYVE